MSRAEPNTWVSELPADYSRTGTLHAVLAAEIRDRPGVWRQTGTYAYRGGATNAASVIRRGASDAWRARAGGRYEAEAITTKTGEHQVFVRWVADDRPGPSTPGGGSSR